MSSSKLISPDDLTAYERWELPNVDGHAKRKSKVKEEEIVASSVKPLTAEQVEEIRSAAQREGFEKGHKEGLAAAANEIHTSTQNLQKIIQSFSQPLEDVDARVEQELLTLVIAVARQLIRRELKTDPGQIVGVVREALQVLPAATRKTRVYLHPEDAVLLRESLAAGDEASWRIIEDVSLTRGGCRIQTEHSSIDATVEKRIAAIANHLLGSERASDQAVEEEHHAAQ
ncbi:MAG: flagellar assembly protein FliH [Thiohalomonadaceae bacterium]